MIVGEERVQEFVSEVWSSMLGMEVQPSMEEITMGGGEKFLTACIQITGDWEGSVTVDCIGSLATLAAAAMFETAPEETEMEDIQDAMGELANMLGGNIKTLLPGKCSLSLPSVTSGTDYSVNVPGSVIETRATMTSSEKPVIVTVLKRKDKN